MTNRTISLFIKISIIFIAIAGIALCIFWYPFSVSFSLAEINVEHNGIYWVQVLFYWGASVPCFAILVIVWLIANTIKKDDVFSLKLSKKLTIIFYLLFAASCVFLVGNTVFTVLKWNLFTAIYYFIGVFGIILSFAVYVISKYVIKAQILKEENESIL